MELKEFITETITAIADATSELQKRYEPEGVLVNPPLDPQNPTSLTVSDMRAHARHVRDVQFDVALTVGKETTKSGKAGLKMYVAEVGGGADSAKTSQQVSRVSFSIPVAFRGSDLEKVNTEQSDEERERVSEMIRSQRRGPRIGA